jgi:hypothetical protein
MGDKKVITIKQYNPDWYPPCFESKEQYKEYMWQSLRTNQPADPNNYCMDCTRKYKLKMLKEKKCEHPETIFVAWRSTYKDPKDVTGEFYTLQDKPDVIGISNVSKFWETPFYDQHPNKPKEV